MELLLFIGSLVYILIVFSRAGECYFCGSRKVVSRSKWGTRGLCDSCWVKGKDLPK